MEFESTEVKLKPQFADEFDLAAELAKQATEKIVLDLPDGINISEPSTNLNNDFDQEILDEAAKDSGTENTATQAMFDSSKLAPVIVDTLDTVMQTVFPMVYEGTLDNSDRVAMKGLIRQYRKSKNANMSLDPEQQRIMEILCDYESYVDSLPLSETEKKSLVEPLRELLKDVNYQTSPSNALILAAVMIMIPRGLPLAKNKFFTDKPEPVGHS